MRNLAQTTRNRDGISLPRKSSGFSLFELIAFIILAAIVYSASVDRFSSFPAEAERANFMAVSTQIQTGVQLESMSVMVRGNASAFEKYENANPMDLLLETPVNYLGAFGAIDLAAAPRRSWYFDSTRGELVYLISNFDGVFSQVNGNFVPTDEIRFRIEVEYRGGGNSGSVEGSLISSEGPRRVSGMLIRPTSPFSWGTSGADMVLEATTPAPNPLG